MKNIVIFALHLNYGGIEKFICDVANVLCEKHNVTIVSTYKLVDEPFFKLDDKVKVKYLMDFGPNRNEFKDAVKGKNPIKIAQESFRAVSIITSKRNLLVKYVKNLKCDVIITTRLEQSAIIQKYADKNIYKIASEHNYHNNNEKYMKSLFYATRNFDRFVLLSKSLAEFYKLLFTDEKVEVKYIGHFVERTNQVVKEGAEVISVGRLSAEKGFDDLLNVSKLMPDVNFNIVGDGDQRQYLENEIEANNLNNVILHGSKTITQIQEMYSKCFAFVMCSYSESFGLVLIEAQAFGVPCVAFDGATGPQEVITNGVNGYLVEDRNISKMVEAINNVKINHTKLSRKSIENSKLYSYDKFCKKWLDIVDV